MSTAINVSSIASSLTGTTFDWQSFVDTMMTYQSATITSLQAEQTKNTEKTTALTTLQTYLQSLQTATKALSESTLFGSRTAASSTSGSTWSITAASGAQAGSHTFNVTQLASASKRTGATDISSAISTTGDVSGVTLASMPTAKTVTAGTFTVNGATVTIALTDSLQDVFDKISTATGGGVTASYDASTDKISLSSSSSIVLGGANDSSNFLSAVQLSNNGTGTVSSANALGAVSTSSPLASARLKNSITAVDSSGNGSFSINGVAISYNINSDSLSTIISNINASSAGVTASYDSAADRMILVNTATGDTGFGLSEDSGGFLDAVGLSMSNSEAVTTLGNNATLTVDDGSTITSTTNTFDSTLTGITGLTVTATSTGSQTITVSSDTTSMKSAIQAFIDAYNVVQSNIDLETTITTTTSGSSTSVSTSTLSNTREVDAWASSLRSKAFSAVSGLSGTISRLADLGIDFSGSSNLLSIKDSTKLDDALANNSDDVEEFFSTATTGFASVLSTYITKIAGSDSDSTSGTEISTITSNITKENTSIDAQISAIQTRLESERQRMIAAFQAMQTAQANAKSMIETLTSISKSSSSSS